MLIDLKIDFNNIHIPQVNRDFRELCNLSSTVSRKIRNKLYDWSENQKQILK